MMNADLSAIKRFHFAAHLHITVIATDHRVTIRFEPVRKGVSN